MFSFRKQRVLGRLLLPCVWLGRITQIFCNILTGNANLAFDPDAFELPAMNEIISGVSTDFQIGAKLPYGKNGCV